MKKKSIKILITVAGVFTALLVTGLVILRMDLIEIINELEKNSTFREVSVDKFHAVNFSENWSVHISPGMTQKVEVEFNEDQYSPDLTTKNGVLYFRVEHYGSKLPQKIRARISTPFIRLIEAEEGTVIEIERFESDSLKVVMKDKGSFRGKENKFEYISFKTMGEVGIELTDDPFQ